jgi:ABC-type lipoprotein export system ATPase subunit
MPAIRVPTLRGRTGERETLDRRLTNVRQGRSEVIVIRGEAGVGKTALMACGAGQAGGVRVAQVDGVGVMVPA